MNINGEQDTGVWSHFKNGTSTWSQFSQYLTAWPGCSWSNMLHRVRWGGINPNQGLGRKYIEDSLVCSQGLHPGDECEWWCWWWRNLCPKWSPCPDEDEDFQISRTVEPDSDWLTLCNFSIGVTPLPRWNLFVRPSAVLGIPSGCFKRTFAEANVAPDRIFTRKMRFLFGRVRVPGRAELKGQCNMKPKNCSWQLNPYRPTDPPFIATWWSDRHCWTIHHVLQPCVSWSRDWIALDSLLIKGAGFMGNSMPFENQHCCGYDIMLWQEQYVDHSFWRVFEHIEVAFWRKPCSTRESKCWMEPSLFEFVSYSHSSFCGIGIGFDFCCLSVVEI